MMNFDKNKTYVGKYPQESRKSLNYDVEDVAKMPYL